jgi:hypothetical protein
MLSLQKIAIIILAIVVFVDFLIVAFKKGYISVKIVDETVDVIEEGNGEAGRKESQDYMI